MIKYLLKPAYTDNSCCGKNPDGLTQSSKSITGVQNKVVTWAPRYQICSKMISVICFDENCDAVDVDGFIV